jgi:uncharacterized protein YerC
VNNVSKRLSAVQEAMFKEMWLDGVPMNKISDATGLSLNTISGHARRRGLPHHGKPNDYLRVRWLKLMPELRAAVKRNVMEIVGQ